MRSVVRSTSQMSVVVVCVAAMSGCNLMNGYVMNESGKHHYAHQNYAAAAEEFRRAYLDDPFNPDYAHNLAAALRKDGETAEAERLYRTALQLEPRHQPSYHGLASLMMEQGRGQEAQQLIAGWAGSQPYVPEAHVEMAWLHKQQGNTAAATQSLQRALAINPNHHTAMAHLGEMHEQQGNHQMAMAMYDRSLDVYPYQPAVKQRIARLEESGPSEMEMRMAGMPSPGKMAGGGPGGMYGPSQMAFGGQPGPMAWGGNFGQGPQMMAEGGFQRPIMIQGSRPGYATQGNMMSAGAPMREFAQYPSNGPMSMNAGPGMEWQSPSSQPMMTESMQNGPVVSDVSWGVESTGPRMEESGSPYVANSPLMDPGTSGNAVNPTLAAEDPEVSAF